MRLIALIAVGVIALSSPAAAQTCQASWYGGKHHGGRTASGARYNQDAMTAAMRYPVPFGSRKTVTNLSNGRSVSVTINDRGPFVRGRCIDLSRAAARAIGISGVGKVRVE